MQEEKLIERASNGEAAAFRELVEQNKKKIYYLSLDLTGNHHDAEDLSQEVFIKAYKSISRFRGEARFSSWLYRITVNTNINQQRKKMVKVMRKSEDVDNIKLNIRTNNPDSDPERQTRSSQIQCHIDAALEKLSTKERCIFVLRHYEDILLSDIAEIMSISTGAVKSTLFRVIRKLRKELSFYKNEIGDLL